MAYTPDQVGMVVTYWARWVTAKGLLGPWSVGFSILVAGAGAAVNPDQGPDGGRSPKKKAA